MAMQWETLSGKFSLAASMLAMLYAQTNDRIVVVSNYTQVPPYPEFLPFGSGLRIYCVREESALPGSIHTCTRTGTDSRCNQYSDE